jgi:hypothetical protein
MMPQAGSLWNTASCAGMQTRAPVSSMRIANIHASSSAIIRGVRWQRSIGFFHPTVPMISTWFTKLFCEQNAHM